jgi:hypothetical protein
MQTYRVVICFVVIGLLVCNGKANKITDQWFGNYNAYVTYGPLDEFSTMFIDYNIKIYQDSCEFSGMGYKTDFTDLCKAIESTNGLYLMYKKTLSGDGFTDHSDVDTLAVLIKDGTQYYIKSAIIADKDWNYNRKVLLDKKK